MAPGKGTRRTIALFIDGAYRNSYHLRLISGIIDAAQRSGVNPVIVCGGELESPQNYNKYQNIMYRWAAAGAVEGYIIAPTVFNYVGPETKRTFLLGLAPLPIVTFDSTEEASTNVLIDNASGFRELIRHLIRNHGYKRPAFLKGPENNVDANERYAVYREVLAECGLSENRDLVVPGMFVYASGLEAVRVLWDERKVIPDVIIAANDAMAIGAMDELARRGVNVPGQVAVTGFDDSDDAWRTNPPMTTVRHPSYEQAVKSLEVLLARIRGEEAPTVLKLPTEAVYRRSCGCFSKLLRDVISPLSGVQETGGTGEGFEAATAAVSSDAGRLSQTMSVMCGKLAHAFASDLRSGHALPQSEFLLDLESGLRRIKVPVERAMDWHVAVSIIRRRFLPAARLDAAMRDTAEEILQAAHIMISECLQQRQISTPRQDAMDIAHRQAVQGMTTTFNVPDLMGALTKSLPAMGIPECHIGLYCNPKEPAGEVELALSYSIDASAESGGRARTYPSPNALIESLCISEKPRVLIIQALSFRDESLGFMVIGVGESLERTEFDLPLYDNLSSSLMGARLVDEVERRSRELEKTTHSLRENQRILLVSEKMASLGRLTAGMAHEMNTPLAAVRAALVEAGGLVDELKGSIGDAEVTDDDYREITGELASSMGLAAKAADRLAAFIRSIKSQTRTVSDAEHRIFDAVAEVEDALLLTGHTFKKGKCRAVFSHSAETISLLGVPGRFTQMVVNLVTNAVEASAPLGGDVEIVLERKPGSVDLTVRDHGIGIQPENLTKVFDPMFSTKPFGGATGLGLTIVHDIVTGEFGGTIDVESTVGQGTVFSVRLPFTEGT